MFEDMTAIRRRAERGESPYWFESSTMRFFAQDARAFLLPESQQSGEDAPLVDTFARSAPVLTVEQARTIAHVLRTVVESARQFSNAARWRAAGDDTRQAYANGAADAALVVGMRAADAIRELTTR